MNSLSAAGSKVWLSRLGRRCLQGSPRGLQPSRRQGSLPQTPLDEAQAGGAGSPDRSMVGDGVSVPALPTPRGAREETDRTLARGGAGTGPWAQQGGACSVPTRDFVLPPGRSGTWSQGQPPAARLSTRSSLPRVSTALPTMPGSMCEYVCCRHRQDFWP